MISRPLERFHFDGQRGQELEHLVVRAGRLDDEPGRRFPRARVGEFGRRSPKMRPRRNTQDPRMARGGRSCNTKTSPSPRWEGAAANSVRWPGSGDERELLREGAVVLAGFPLVRRGFISTDIGRPKPESDFDSVTMSG